MKKVRLGPRARQGDLRRYTGGHSQGRDVFCCPVAPNPCFTFGTKHKRMLGNNEECVSHAHNVHSTGISNVLGMIKGTMVVRLSILTPKVTET